MYIEVKRN